jgi:predicted short-subunit dehydrogenase-like oxidoreductase (DUF2520 family)
MSIFNIAIIGVGKLGGALALAFSKKSYDVTELVVPNPEIPNEIFELIEPRPRILSPANIEELTADILFITTPDSEIEKISENLAPKLEYLPYIFHTSGALSSDALFALNKAGCNVASMHPLISISDAKIGVNKFKDAYFCVEGDVEASEVAKRLVEDLGGNWFTVPSKLKPLYHASAVMACGHLTTLVSASIEMLSTCGLSNEESQMILLPLIKSTVENLSVQTPAQALTGTFARADIETLQKHLKIIKEKTSTEILNIYLQLGMRSLDLAQQQGANTERLEMMRNLLKTTN